MDNITHLIQRSGNLFKEDIDKFESTLTEIVRGSSFLVLGGAGTIGQAVVKEIFKRKPKRLHVVDVSENNLVELVRDIRSSIGYIPGDFQTFTLDIGSLVYDCFFTAYSPYDYVLNLSALKHVRNEKDPFTLMRMIEVNVLNTLKTIQQSRISGARKYFCVSTDKAVNPVNMMGGSKRIMELFAFQQSRFVDISMARFANVAFSDGSLLYSFSQRFLKRQPIVAPHDVKRYFITPKESGELCLLSCLIGENRDIFFPKLSEELSLTSFADIAERYIVSKGYKPYMCKSEEEARKLIKTLPEKGLWPCLFTSSDTTGEKQFEEFYSDGETIDMNRFQSIGIIKNDFYLNDDGVQVFIETIQSMLNRRNWTKEELVTLFHKILPSFTHLEKEKYLDSKM
jgi:FlaA1/EpsC-like NDP-sugar epimerase